MDASKVRNFRISRHSIDDNTLELIVLNKEGHERIHLIGALDEFQQFLHKELYNACASVIEKIIPDSATIKAEISRSMEVRARGAEQRKVGAGPESADGRRRRADAERLGRRRHRQRVGDDHRVVAHAGPQIPQGLRRETGGRALLREPARLQVPHHHQGDAGRERALEREHVVPAQHGE